MVPVELIRYAIDDSTVPQIELRYGQGGKSRTCWWPDTPRCWDQINQVMAHFLADRDSLGKPFREVTDADKHRGRKLTRVAHNEGETEQ